jgi:signal transduction histidine kinase/FixJ family two-component response regulator
VAQSLLKEAGIASAICANLAEFGAALGDETYFAVVTEEAMRSADLSGIAFWIGTQPSWSDLPFIVLTRRGGGLERNPDAARLSELLGNVSFLERPFHPTTLISIARSAAKGRQRQYDARARIEALHEGEQRLRIALVAGHLGSWELDLTTWTLVASVTCKAQFGRTAVEPFTYEDLLSAIHPDDRQQAEDAMQVSIETGVDYAVKYRIIWRDGSQHWAEIHARLVADRKGNRSLVGVSADVTVRKMAEDDLRRLNETLEERVAARTAELEHTHEIVLAEIAQRERAEDLLRQSQKMEMLGQITGGVAHDFNNLLMAVIGNLDLLRKHVSADPRTTRLIAGALQGARRGEALTQRLLAFARRQDLKVEPTNLIDLINGMRNLLERSVGSQAELSVSLLPTVPLTLIDANQIELALLNLVVNARDAMPMGGSLTITVDVAQTDGLEDLPPGTYVRLIVSDTGHGMDAETLAKATEPFFSTKELGKGTGLGLSMVHGLAKQLNGALRLTSEVGRGTRAELWLPATAQVVDIDARAAHDTPEETVISRMTILVVDDDPLIAMSTVDMLEDLGHDVIEANSGARALEILQNGPKVDFLITDYSMPKMTGAQLAEAARELQPDLPILLATGYADLPPGFDIDLPRLGKPYQQGQLAAHISKVLNAKAA